MRPSISYILICSIFCTGIYVPFFGGIFEEDKDTSKIEKRSLSKFPEIDITLDGISNFPKLFDTYYTDHFGIRDQLVEYYKSVKYNLGDSPSDDVTLGKDGWLFLGSIKKGYNKYSDPIGDARNINLFSDDELQKLANDMAFLNSWLNSRDIKYILVIVPNKHTVYLDKLPDYISKSNEKSSTDQLVNYLEQYTNVTVVDLRKKLIERKNEHQLYFKTDTHWNHYGANIAQYEIIREIEKFFPNSIKSEYRKMQDGVLGGGDLAGFIGITDFNESNPQPVFEKTCDPIKHPASTKIREPHSYSCDGPELTALIYRDSFFSALQPYFARKFKRSTYIWKKLTYASLNKYVDTENPDIVIEEWVERSLPLIPEFEAGFKNDLNKKRFVCSDNPIFINKFKELTYNGQIKRIRATNESLSIESTGKNPLIIFPALSAENGNEYIVHIALKSSVKSTLQLFYSDSEVTGFSSSEASSIQISIRAGNNDIYMALDSENIGNRLRFKPISMPGKVGIKTIEIRKIDNQLTKTCNQTK